jgi:transcriptional adapter 2-alpha
MLSAYNKRLDERERRRAFVLEYGLLDARRMQGLETRRLPHEREAHARLRVFAR